jgi:hypothetical protein
MQLPLNADVSFAMRCRDGLWSLASASGELAPLQLAFKCRHTGVRGWGSSDAGCKGQLLFDLTRGRDLLLPCQHCLHSATPFGMSLPLAAVPSCAGQCMDGPQCVILQGLPTWTGHQWDQCGGRALPAGPITDGGEWDRIQMLNPFATRLPVTAPPHTSTR